MSLELVQPVTVDPDRLMNSREVADLLGVDVSWVKNHCTTVEPFLPHVVLGGGRYTTRRFRREDILTFIKERMVYRPAKRKAA